MNDVIKNLNSMILCDSECQKRKKTDELLLKLREAKNNKKNAKSNLEKAEKAYKINRDGIVKYNKEIQEKSEKDAEKIYKENMVYLNKFKTKIETLESIDKHHNEVIKKLEELLKIKNRENENYEKVFENKIANIETNDRRVYYEEVNTEWLDNLKYVLWILYIISVTVLLYKKFDYKSVIYWVTSIIMILSIFYMNYLVNLYYWLIALLS